MTSLREIALALVATSAVLLGARGAAAEVLSGTYSAEDTSGHGARLSVVAAEGHVLLSFAAAFAIGSTVNTCHCLARGEAAGAARYRIAGPEDLSGSLKADAGSVVLEVTRQECCGEGFSGVQEFAASTRRPLRVRTVKAHRAQFLALDERPTGAYVVAGDRVETGEADPVTDLVVARFVGRRTTLGFLRVADLE